MTDNASPYIGHVLDIAFSHAQAAVVLLTGDDMVRLGRRFVTPADQEFEKRLMPQARPNVLFEMGMAFGKYPERTLIVEFGSNRPFTDITGRNSLRFSDNAAIRKKIAERLKTAGCLVRTDFRSDWLTAGDFASALHPPDLMGEEWHGLTITRRHANAEEKATYKPKVWVDIRNDNNACVAVRHLGWRTVPGGVSIKYGPASMQLRMGEFWCPEAEGVEQLHVPFGETFRVWVQPGEPYGMRDLETRCESSGKIGTLLLRVNEIEVHLHV
jgi:hypothetical protein